MMLDLYLGYYILYTNWVRVYGSAYVYNGQLHSERVSCGPGGEGAAVAGWKSEGRGDAEIIILQQQQQQQQQELG